MKLAKPALVGVGAFLLCALLSSQAVVGPIFRLEYMPHPRDMIVIRGPLPYTVPAGKVLVVTGLGSNRTDAGNYCILLVDGVEEVTHPSAGQAPFESSVGHLPAGFRIDAGSVVTMKDGNNQPHNAGRAWGYLANQ